MKTRLLAGLTALVLGAFTSSCSNILEENGVINNVAESGMGELRINLSTDASLNVSTKAEVESGVTLTDEQKKSFTLTATKDSQTQDLGQYGEGSYQLPVGTWTIKAVYTSMGSDVVLDWDKPNFEGSNNVTITADKQASTAINAKLTNSIIQVNINALSDATIEELYVYAGEENHAPTAKEKKSLYENGALISNKKLYVKSGVSNARIVIKGYLTADQSKTFKINKIITDNGTNTTSGQKLYNVTYSLAPGSTTITITINDQVEQVDISVPVAPYNSTTSETPSSSSGE